MLKPAHVSVYSFGNHNPFLHRPSLCWWERPCLALAIANMLREVTCHIARLHRRLLLQCQGDAVSSDANEAVCCVWPGHYKLLSMCTTDPWTWIRPWNIPVNRNASNQWYMCSSRCPKSCLLCYKSVTSKHTLIIMFDKNKQALHKQTRFRSVLQVRGHPWPLNSIKSLTRAKTLSRQVVLSFCTAASRSQNLGSQQLKLFCT